MAVIVIDPGHYGGYNPGVCYNYYEGNTMLVLADFLGEALRARGADVRYTRTSDAENPSLEERGRMAAGADLFISLHSDAADDPNVRGVTSFFSVGQPWAETFAADIGRAVAGVMGNSFRGTIARPYPNNPNLDYYGVIRAAVAAGARNAFLIEHGFHTNQEDCEILSNHEYLQQIARASAEVIAGYFGLSQASCCNFRYSVQSGDSLYRIAQRFGVTQESIASLNNIRPPYTITPGQVLVIQLCY